jgi:ATP-dependent Lhr-like helicase
VTDNRPWPGFSPATEEWFAGAFAAPTAAQREAWAVIGRGEHTLVVAPTGSGKTLAAFLWSLDRLAGEPVPPQPSRRCRVLYVSPMKALAVDVEKNLRAPLAGIRQAAHRLRRPEPDIRVAIRSGDTPAEQRRAFTRQPPDVLITTPESLFLLLTSAAREALRGVDTVIVDEIHAVCGTKRGAHLALSLERLDVLLDRPAQRIGLSATVRPVPEVARFLAGGRPVAVVQPPAVKTVELEIVVPVEDMSALGEPTDDLTGPAAGAQRRASIWPHVEERVLDLVEEHRSTIVFANSRRLAERLTARLNELAYQRRYGEPLALTAMPAQVMAESGVATGAPPVVARTHHGSMSREQRVAVEEDLKAGRLPAVVATSSLELGIDMGAVDLVVQVESPPSVAAGLQRVGRAGHQVGATSRGVLFPKYRGDLVESAVVAERMRAGAIEEIHYPRNPLDVLAQQVVAMVAMDPWPVAELAAVVRRAAPFGELPASALEAVLDMLSGRYPSDGFAELRPRLVWDRVGGVLTARPAAQRLAVTSGGTIPDRGLFGVYLASSGAGGPPGTAAAPVRVGELDEEMVYESRVGDVFLLGSSSWRIEDITHDRVLVSPAPGEPGRMPFWKGDAPGRPAELGRALGAFLRELAGLGAEGARQRARAAGLDRLAADNLVAYLAEQRQATGQLPDDRTVVVERFHDELGDWRVVVHSPFGAPVNAPWALAIAARLRERYGMDVAAMHADDGIVLRLPDTGLPDTGLPDTGAAPEAGLAIFDAEEVDALVTAAVGGSALFAARFRECAARALLLPRRDPRRRTPLWQQRQRAAQLLSVAAQFPSFPITLEAIRECLQDVFDLPGLVGLMRDIAARRVRVVEVETPEASPFARSLLFGYVGAFLYEGDAPLAERRAQALALDSTLLAELLGQAELRELLDPAAVAEVEAELGWLTDERRVSTLDGLHDALRILGDLTTAEALARGATPALLAELETARRALRVRIAGQERWIAIEDAGRVRDALGVALPVGVPEAFTEPVADPLGDLVGRYARTHGPFHAAECARRLGLGPAVVGDTLARLAAAGRVVSGELRPGGSGTEWCDAEVLRRLRRRSLARLRREVEPVPVDALARFLPVWQGVTGGAAAGTAGQAGSMAGRGSNRWRGAEGVLRAVEQLQGAAVPASALESLVLPARVEAYSPALLDELTAAGEVVWAGAGGLPGNDGWVQLAPADSAALVLSPPEEITLTPLHHAVLAALDGDQAYFFRSLSDRVFGSAGGSADGSFDLRPPDDRSLAGAVWDLVWAGRLTNDTLAPLRARLGAGSTAHRRRAAPPRGRYGRAGRPAMPSRAGPPTTAGRWWRLPERELDPTRRAHALTEVLLDRHGVLTRGAVLAERVVGGFAAVYPVLRGLEENGSARRGYFVDGLGAAQFASPGAVDRLRGYAGARREPGPALVLAATDPANAYGAALPWPEQPDRPPAEVNRRPAAEINRRPAAEAGERPGAGHKPGRKAGALVVLVDGHLVLYVERGGRSLLSFSDNPTVLQPAADALALAVREGGLGTLAVQRADGEHVFTEPGALVEALATAGFRATPRGLRLRA